MHESVVIEISPLACLLRLDEPGPISRALQTL